MTAIGHAGHAPSATTGVGDDSPRIQRIALPVVGLTCGACVQAVEKALRAVPGVSGATVNLTQGRAFVEYDPGQVTVTALHEAIKAAGYRSETATARFRIEGITCASCVTKIETALRETPGVLTATVSIGSEEAVVEYGWLHARPHRGGGGKTREAHVRPARIGLVHGDGAAPELRQVGAPAGGGARPGGVSAEGACSSGTRVPPGGDGRACAILAGD